MSTTHEAAGEEASLEAVVDAADVPAPAPALELVHVAEPPAALPRHVTLGAFQKRLGPMRVFAIDNSSAPKCIALRSFLNRFTYVDLDDPDLPPLLGMLAQAGLPEVDPEFPGSGPITPELIAEVLGTEVKPGERP